MQVTLIHSFSLDRMNAVKQIDFHQMDMHEQARNVELATLSFYFNRNPDMIAVTLDEKNGKYIFLFSHMQGLSNTCMKKIQDINKAAHGLYSITIDKISSPTQGLRFTILLNKNKAELSYNEYKSIKQEPGIVFSIYSKELLHSLRNKDKPQLQTAFMPNAVIIDCGHGGADWGARGHFNTIEKEINLHIGLEVAGLLRNKGLTVLLTRDADQTVPLDVRTRFANTHHAQALVSIHTNAGLNNKSQGIETYYFDHSLIKQRFSSLAQDDSIVINEYMNDKARHNKKLARCVHESVLEQVKSLHQIAVDRHIKPAVSQILLGVAAMPAALIEIGFISHEYEAQLLKKSTYQKAIAQGICNGLLTFLNNTKQL